MDWRQLRSSVRQRRGVRPGEGAAGEGGADGPAGGPCVRPINPAALARPLRQVAATLRASVYPSVQQGR